MAGSSFPRRLVVGLVLAGLAVGGSTYYLSVFAPRERAGTPSRELAALLAAKSPFDRALWIASPHQNLGALDERVGDLDLYLTELSTLAGVKSPRLPRFGPFALPPARELALAWNGSGDRFLAVARIETGIGFVARLAGRLAGNPWLAGGQVTSGGRSLSVRWQGALWIVSSEGAAELPVADASAGVAGAAGIAASDATEASEGTAPPAIAQFVLRSDVGPLPAGRFRLARGSDGLEVRSGELPRAVQAASDWSFPGVALWVSSTDRGPIGGPGLFLLWEASEGAIPRVAVLQRGGGRTFRLPGESILAMVGAGEPGQRLGWIVRGTQKSARREALLMVPWFERHLPRPGDRGPWLGRAGRLVPSASARTLGLLLRNLEKLPLVPAAELQRIAAAERLLAPFSDCAAIAFEVWHEPEGARLRLCARPSETALGPDDEEGDPSSYEDGEIDEQPSIR